MDNCEDSSLTSTALDCYYSNLYLAHSSIENYKSVRFPANGSPFIQTVCRTLTEKWKTHSLIDIFTNDIAHNLQSWEALNGEIWNLTPEFRMLGRSTSHKENTLHSTMNLALESYSPSTSPMPSSKYGSVALLSHNTSK